MEDKSFAGMSEKEKFTLLRKDLTALQKKVAQFAAFLNELKQRVDRLDGQHTT